MPRIFKMADLPTRERLCPLTASSVVLLVLVLVLVLSSWRPAVAIDATVPTSVVSLAITSNPGPDQYYLRGEPIEVTVTFSGSVTVTGKPGIRLGMGPGTTLAIYRRGSGTTALVFVWNVWQLSEDHDGVSVPAGTILLREGSIQDDSGDAVDLAHTGLPTQSGHKVDDVNPALIAALTRATENTVTMFWDEVLDGNHVPPASGFDVRKLVSIGTFSEQEPISVTHVAVSGNSVTLTFATEVEAGPFVTARYGYLPLDRPLSIHELVAGSPYLRDRAGNPAYNVRASAKVSGTPPTSGPNVTSVTLVSDPAPPPRGSSYWIGSGEYLPLIENHADTESDTGYKNGEVVHVDVAFSGPIVIDARGAKPSIGIMVGSVTRQAKYLGVDGEFSLSETDSQPHCSGFREHMFTSSACSGDDVLRGTTIRFQYVVAVGDEDTDGLSIPANGILLNGGKITDVWGNSAVLTHSALATQSGHKVDGILPQLAATGGVVVDGSMLTLSWSEDVIVDPGGLRAALALSFFSITGNDDVTRTITDVLSVEERAFTLSVEPAVSHGETGLTVSYWPTNLEDDIRVHSMFRAAFQSFGIRDGAGNFAAGFSDRAVENRTAGLVTARFENVPESHDGSTAFTFDLHFSENIPGLSYKTVAGDLVEITGANVTGARRLTQGSNQGWRVTVEPSANDDIAISLPARACGETAAICTSDNRALSEGISATVQMVLQSAQQSEGPLTASFENVPDWYDGTTAFTVELHFSEAPSRLSYVTVRDGLFDVTNGAVTKARRVTQGSNLAFEVTVEPSADTDVTLTVRGTDDCAAPHAVCRGDGRKLAAGASATIAMGAPIAVTVADTEVEEAEGATLDFVVSMNRAAAQDIQIWYRAYDGTATAGADYVAVYSSFTMTAGETTKTVSVSVLDDALDEGAETVKFWLTGVRGLSVSQLTDAHAVGTIRNTDVMPKAWIARFGRTVAEHVLDAVETRLDAAPKPGMEASLAGQRIGGAALPEDVAERQEWDRSRSLSDWLKGGTDPQRQNLDSRTITERDLLTGSSFALTAETKGSDMISIWGRGAVTRFTGQEGDLSVDGEVATGMLGADWTDGAWKSGLLVSHSLGDGGYRGASAGTVTSTLTGIFPWARYALRERVSAWGVAGYGEGSLMLEPEEQATIRTDLGLWMAAAGLSGVLVDGGNDGPTLAANTDAMVVRTSSDAVSGGIGNLAEAEAEVTRLRLGLEGSQPFTLTDGATLTPSVEIGVRHDGGDAETGFGVDIGGGLAWSDTIRGITADFRGRGLLTHEADGFRERALSGSLSWDPQPASDRGPRASLTQRLGGSASGGMDALLSHDTLTGLAANDNGDNLLQRRLEARFGYGFAAFGNRFTSLPEFAAGLSNTVRDYSLGWRLVRGGGSFGGGSLELSVEMQRRESANNNIAPEHQVGFRVNARW